MPERRTAPGALKAAALRALQEIGKPASYKNIWYRGQKYAPHSSIDSFRHALRDLAEKGEAIKTGSRGTALYSLPHTNGHAPRPSPEPAKAAEPEPQPAPAAPSVKIEAIEAQKPAQQATAPSQEVPANGKVYALEVGDYVINVGGWKFAHNQGPNITVWIDTTEIDSATKHPCTSRYHFFKPDEVAAVRRWLKSQCGPALSTAALEAERDAALELAEQAEQRAKEAEAKAEAAEAKAKAAEERLATIAKAIGG